MNDFIRDENVDLSKYLPPFLSKDKEFSAKLAAESAEHDEVRKQLSEILDQFFVETATWGLDNWEDFLGIATDKGIAENDRRQRIIQKIKGSQTVTLDFMTKLVNLYITNGQGNVIDNPEEYAIEIRCPGGEVTDYQALNQAIATYIPAHIGYRLVDYITSVYKIFCSQQSHEQEVLREEIKNVADGDALWHVGFGMAVTSLIDLRGAELAMPVQAVQYGYAAVGQHDMEVLNAGDQ